MDVQGYSRRVYLFGCQRSQRRCVCRIQRWHALRPGRIRRQFVVDSGSGRFLLGTAGCFGRRCLRQLPVGKYIRLCAEGGQQCGVAGSPCASNQHAAAGLQLARRGEEVSERSSFLKKRTKRRLLLTPAQKLWPWAHKLGQAQKIKVFCFFSSEKKILSTSVASLQEQSSSRSSDPRIHKSHNRLSRKARLVSACARACSACRHRV